MLCFNILSYQIKDSTTIGSLLLMMPFLFWIIWINSDIQIQGFVQQERLQEFYISLNVTAMFNIFTHTSS